MPVEKEVSGDAAAVAAAIRDYKPKDRGWVREWLPGLLTAGMTGLIGVLGAIYGADTQGNVQIRLAAQQYNHDDQQQRQKDARADAQFLLNKAEQVILLVEKTPITNAQVTQAILATPYTPNHMAALPDDPEQVVALVTLYFPTAVDDARAYEAKCAEHIGAVQENLMAQMKHAVPSTTDSQIYQDALKAGDLVIFDVMKAVGKTYKKR